jgi:hypothetical protein
VLRGLRSSGNGVGELRWTVGERLARRVREGASSGREGKSSMARPVFIERGRGEGETLRGEGVTLEAINGSCINGERVGKEETVALVLHNARR